MGVASAQGTLPIHICSTSECSSFSDTFIAAQSKQNSHFKWDRIETVPVITADSLVEKYGIPSFIKIDVEGFEDEVLAGLSRPVPALSFEVRPHDSTSAAGASLDRLGRLGRYEFNISLEETLTFALPEWTDGRSMLAALERMPCSGWRYGDIYARRLEN